MKPLWAVVDRIEDGKAVLDVDAGADAPRLGRLVVDRVHLPPGAREGSVLRLVFEDDAAERGRRVAEIGNLQDALRARTRGRKRG